MCSKDEVCILLFCPLLTLPLLISAGGTFEGVAIILTLFQAAQATKKRYKIARSFDIDGIA